MLKQPPPGRDHSAGGQSITTTTSSLYETDFIVNSTRRTSIATGALFILATSAALAAAALKPALAGTAYLTGVADHRDRLAVAALLYLVAAGTSVGIALALYPVLKMVNAAVAIGAVIFRTIEAVFYTTAVVNLLSILTLGQQLATTPPENHASILAIADSLVSIRDHSNVAAIFAFSVGALMYYTLFYRSRLIPRWLSGWGIAAALLMLTASLLALFSNTPVTGYTLLILPILIQEMVLAVWLLAKGLSPSPPGRRPNAQAPTAERPNRGIRSRADAVGINPPGGRSSN
jgi:hypothetical protein